VVPIRMPQAIEGTPERASIHSPSIALRGGWRQQPRGCP
jgi:hypothetical protein